MNTCPASITCNIQITHPTTFVNQSIKHTNYANISIKGAKGSEGLGYALTHPSSRLLTLNLKMNTNLRSAGAAHLATALLRGSILQKYIFYNSKSRCKSSCRILLNFKPHFSLNLSACGITREDVEGASDCGQLLASAVAAGRTPLRDLDLSVNDLGPVSHVFVHDICKLFAIGSFLILDVQDRRSLIV